MRSITFGRILVASAVYVLLCMPRPATALPSVSVSDIRVQEGNTGTTTATFTVNRSSPAIGTPFSVSYNTRPTTGAATEGTACGGNVDYIRASGTLPFSAYDRSKTFSVQICPDYTPEKDESIVILVGKSLVKCTIANDDSPNVDVVDYVETEGNSGSPRAMFRVNLSSPPAQGVTVWYTVSSQSPMHGTADTATAGTTCGGSADYIGVTSGTVPFGQGEVGKLVYVPICPDTTPEPDETFHMQLTRAEGAVIRDGSALGTIRNDDLPVLTVEDFTAQEPPDSDPSAGCHTFWLRLSSSNHNGCSVDYRIVGGSATLSNVIGACSTGSDFTTNDGSFSGTETWAPGGTEQLISVCICPDAVPEGAETFQIQFSNPRGLSVPVSTVTKTIPAND